MQKGAAAFILMVVAALLGPSAALACKMAPQTPATAPETGPDCGWRYQVAEYRAVSLSGLRNLGSGLIAQDLRDGNACQADVALLVSDCRTGQAVLYGPDRVARMDGPAANRQARLVNALEAWPAGQAISARDVAAAAEAAGITRRVAVPKGAQLRFGEKVLMPLECGCRSLYPGAVN